MLPEESLRSPIREKTAERFGYEWNHFRDFELDEEVASLKTWFRPRRLEDLAGLNVLEAGCGMGRHADDRGSLWRQDVDWYGSGIRCRGCFPEHTASSRGLHRAGRHLPPSTQTQGIRRGVFTRRASPFARSWSRVSAPSPPRFGTRVGSRSGCTAAKEMAGSSTSSTRFAD